MNNNDIMYEKVEEKGFDILSQCVMESTNNTESVVAGLSEVVLTHLIKYDVVKHRQDTDWIRSIQKLYKNKKSTKLKTNEYNNIVYRFDDIYAKARRNARNQLKADYKEFTDISPIERPAKYTLDFILDKDAVDRYIYANAYSIEVRNYLGLGEKLSKAEENAIIPKYTLKEAFPGINK